MQNPLYLHPSDGPHTGTISEKLTKPSNYRAWRRDMEIVLTSKRKLRFVTGVVKRDPEDAKKQDQWDTCNSMVIAWLTGSMSQNVKESVIYVKKAKEIWDQLERRFSFTNGTTKYKLNKAVHDLIQKDKSVLEYYTKINALRDEIDAMRNLPPITTMTPEVLAFVKALNKEREEERLFQFLSGLEEDYAAERSHVLMFSPLPIVEDACARFSHEEAQRELHKEDKVMVETRAMLSKKEEWCSVCDMKGHSKERCWKVIGDWMRVASLPNQKLNL
ncbi:Glutathione S-transferase S1 [Bienertia sinuspersici]